MACALSADISFDCSVGSGGVGKELYVIELNNISSYTESSGTLTAITKVTGKIFRKYQLVQETASFDEKISGNVPNGTLFYETTGKIVFNKQSVAIRNELKLLSVGTVVFVVQDNNQLWKLYGRLNGLRLLDGSISTGVAFTDRNGYELNFTGKESEPAPFVDSTVISTLQTAT